MHETTPLHRRVLGGVLMALAVTTIGVPVSAHTPEPVGLAGMIDTETGGPATIACPVAGEVTFSDSWGAPRSGGRRHEGVDMAALRGTLVVAALAGWAEFKHTSAGGKSVWLTTPSGDKLFYAHLDAWEGDSREVDRGEVIGFVGSTGNAGGPHLHFEVRPGGQALNPYPATSAACAPQPDVRVADGSSAPRLSAPGLWMRLR